MQKPTRADILSAMTTAELKVLEDNLWKSADNLRANSDLKSTEYATPVLGLIFLKFADNKYGKYEAEIEAEYKKLKGTRRSGPSTRSQSRNAVSISLRRPATTTSSTFPRRPT